MKSARSVSSSSSFSRIKPRPRSLAVASPNRSGSNTGKQQQQIRLHHHHHHHQQQRKQQQPLSMECGGDRTNRAAGIVNDKANAEAKPILIRAPAAAAAAAASGDSTTQLQQQQQQTATETCSSSKPVKSIIYLALSDDFASSSEPEPLSESPSTVTDGSPDNAVNRTNPAAVSKSAPGTHYCISSQTTIAIRLAAQTQSADSDLDPTTEPNVKNAMVPRVALSRATYIAPSGAVVAPPPPPASTPPTKSTATTTLGAPANRSIRFNLAAATWAPVCQRQRPLTCTDESRSRDPTASTMEKRQKSVSHQQQVCPSVFHRGKSPSQTLVYRPTVLRRSGRAASTVRQERNQPTRGYPTSTAYLPRDSFAERQSSTCRPPTSWCRMTSSVARRRVQFSPRLQHTAAAIPMPLVDTRQYCLTTMRHQAHTATAKKFHLRDFALLNQIGITFPDVVRSCTIQMSASFQEERVGFQQFNGGLNQNSSFFHQGNGTQCQLYQQAHANLVVHRPASIRSIEASSTGSYLPLLHYRSDCSVLERLSLTARLFPDTGAEQDKSTIASSSTALLTHIDYPLELHRLVPPSVDDAQPLSDQFVLSSASRKFQYYVNRQQLLLNQNAGCSNESNTVSLVGGVYVAPSKLPSRSYIIFQPTATSEDNRSSSSSSSSSESTASSSTISEIRTRLSDENSDTESDIYSIYSWSCSTSDF